MTASKNYHYYGPDAQRVLEEYIFIGRNAKMVEPGHVVVYALPQKKEKPKDDKKHSRGSERSTEDSSSKETQGQESRRGNGFSRFKSPVEDS